MPKAGAGWNAREHGPIEALAENLWRVTGSLPRMSLRRTMIVARRSDGALVVHSAIALREDAMRELESLGPLAYLVVPNGYHRLDAPAFARRYPALRVFAPRGSVKAAAEVVTVHGAYADYPEDEAVRLEPLAGVGDAEGLMLVRSADGLTVVLNDVVFNMDAKRDPLGWFFTTLMGSAPGPRVSRLARLALVKDPSALRADLLRLAELPGLARLVVSHEKVAHGADAAAALRRASTYLRPR